MSIFVTTTNTGTLKNVYAFVTEKRLKTFMNKRIAE
jgi:hypothetical protein